MKRSSIVLVVLALLIVLAGAWFLFWPRVTLPQDPLAAVPADSYGIVRIRVDRVLQSEAWKRLVVQKGQAKGIERVQVTCGFNPLERLTELTVFARPTPGGGVPKFAFAARGDLRHEELIDCVKKFTGGDASALQREDIEGIPTVQSKKGNSRAAFIGRDGVIGGDADSVAAAIQTVLGKAPSIVSDAAFKNLFVEIEQASDITLVAHVPDEVKPGIVQIAEIFGEPLKQLALVKMVGANLTTGSANLTGSATLVTPNPQVAENLVNLGKIAISRLLDIPGIGFTPASGVLRGIQTEARGDRATFAGAIKVSTLESLLEFVPMLDGLADSLPAAAAAARGDAGVEKPKAPTPTVEPLAPAEPAEGHKKSRKAKSE